MHKVIIATMFIFTGLPAQVDFDTQIQPLFDSNCANNYCHGANAGGLDLTTGNSYNQLVDVESHGYAPALRVASGDPVSSVLYDKISGGGNFGQQMPPYPQPPLSDANIALVETWIMELSATEPTTPDLVINEFLASSDQCCPDGNGEMEDFIEIYNPGTTAVDIGGLWITDNLDDPSDWEQIPVSDSTIPITIIVAGGHIVIWADEDQNTQGILHTSGFKLSSGGEEIGLIYISGTDTVFVDSLTFGSQTTDISYGRYPDGSDTWQQMNPTPDMVNVGDLNIDQDPLPLGFRVYQNYPNPFNPITTIQYDLRGNGLVNITIYDMLGRKVKTLVNTNQDAGYKSVIWNATNEQGNPVSAGVYVYQLRAQNFIQTRKMVLLK